MTSSATAFKFTTTSAEPPFVDEADAARWTYNGGVAGFAVVLLRMTQFVLGFVVGGLISLWFVCFVGLNQRARTLAHASYASLAVADIFVRKTKQFLLHCVLASVKRQFLVKYYFFHNKWLWRSWD